VSNQRSDKLSPKIVLMRRRHVSRDDWRQLGHARRRVLQEEAGDAERAFGAARRRDVIARGGQLEVDEADEQAIVIIELLVEALAAHGQHRIVGLVVPTLIAASTLPRRMDKRSIPSAVFAAMNGAGAACPSRLEDVGEARVRLEVAIVRRERVRLLAHATLRLEIGAFERRQIGDQRVRTRAQRYGLAARQGRVRFVEEGALADEVSAQAIAGSGARSLFHCVDERAEPFDGEAASYH